MCVFLNILFPKHIENSLQWIGLILSTDFVLRIKPDTMREYRENAVCISILKNLMS